MLKLSQLLQNPDWPPFQLPTVTVDTTEDKQTFETDQVDWENSMDGHHHFNDHHHHHDHNHNNPRPNHHHHQDEERQLEGGDGVIVSSSRSLYSQITQVSWFIFTTFTKFTKILFLQIWHKGRRAPGRQVHKCEEDQRCSGELCQVEFLFSFTMLCFFFGWFAMVGSCVR